MLSHVAVVRAGSDELPVLASRSTSRRPAAAVAVLLADPAERARVCSSLGPAMPVVSCGRGRELLQLVRRHPIAAVLVGLTDADGEPTLAPVERLRRDFPSLPIVAYCDLSAQSCHALMSLAWSGVGDVVLRGHDDAARAIHRLMETADVHAVRREVMTALASRLCARGAEIVESCLIAAKGRKTVQDLAHSLGCDRRTLAYRLAREGLPSPGAMLGWCRLFLAARLLEDPGRSVEQVAFALDLGSGTALRNTLRHYARLRPADVRARGGLRCLLSIFLASLPDGRVAVAGTR